MGLDTVHPANPEPSIEESHSMSKRKVDHRCPHGERRPYSRPMLRDFGPVGKLTQGGPGTVTEVGMTMGNKFKS